MREYKPGDPNWRSGLEGDLALQPGESRVWSRREARELQSWEAKSAEIRNAATDDEAMAIGRRHYHGMTKVEVAKIVRSVRNPD